MIVSVVLQIARIFDEAMLVLYEQTRASGESALPVSHIKAHMESAAASLGLTTRQVRSAWPSVSSSGPRVGLGRRSNGLAWLGTGRHC